MEKNMIDAAKIRYRNTRNLLAGIYNRLDAGPRLTILLYHRVLPEPGPNPFGMVVTSKTFEKQLDIIAKKYKVVSLDTAASETISGNRAVITFDDGFIDNHKIAFPILKKKGLSAAFFLSTDFIGSSTPPWFWREAVEDSGKDDICMTWENASELARNGMTIGSHGVSHRSLTQIGSSDAADEVGHSKKIIEDNLGTKCDHFAFPFGSRRDYNAALIDHVKKSGFKSCLLNVHGYNNLEKDRFCFKRIIIEEGTNINYLSG